MQNKSWRLDNMFKTCAGKSNKNKRKKTHKLRTQHSQACPRHAICSCATSPRFGGMIKSVTRVLMGDRVHIDMCHLMRPICRHNL